MNGHLYFVCPTDFLEPMINKTFGERNYFYSSLGNSFILNQELVQQIGSIVQTNVISEITFVLSDKNKIVMDTIDSGATLMIERMKPFYEELANHRCNYQFSKEQYSNQVTFIIRQYLNCKLILLKEIGAQFGLDGLNFNALIFDSKARQFNEINLDF